MRIGRRRTSSHETPTERLWRLKPGARIAGGQAKQRYSGFVQEAARKNLVTPQMVELDCSLVGW